MFPDWHEEVPVIARTVVCVGAQLTGIVAVLDGEYRSDVFLLPGGARGAGGGDCGGVCMGLKAAFIFHGALKKPIQRMTSSSARNYLSSK
ncbi:uncharacterized protein A4U43_C03F21290 [Asparagus officinalis]|uniref:Uncharacterized protein n=1 Tax=Asparagus officinalis TaxID=4686 RepID=A0A5P1FBV2_ASPOF|nr:uncharacterized protein A4U43_C03F21290 [Asparagus officinalis]